MSNLFSVIRKAISEARKEIKQEKINSKIKKLRRKLESLEDNLTLDEPMSPRVQNFFSDGLLKKAKSPSLKHKSLEPSLLRSDALIPPCKGIFITEKTPAKKSEPNKQVRKRHRPMLIDQIPIGMKFGKWTVLRKSRIKHQVVCQCECGVKNNVTAFSLLRGHSSKCKSCAGSVRSSYRKKAALIPMEGRRFGKWTIIKLNSRRSSATHRRYDCKCDCGNTSTVLGTSLRAATSTRCRPCGYQEASRTNYLKEDLANKKFNRLTVLKRDPSKRYNWICQCDCGRETSKSQVNLRKGTSKQCEECSRISRSVNMKKTCTLNKLIDLIGKRFGTFTVIERDIVSAKWGAARWLCKCDCGYTESKYSLSLRRGQGLLCPECTGKHIVDSGKQLGVRRLEDLTGKVFNSWTVIARDTKQNASNDGALWLCRCVCDRIYSVSASNLKRDISKRCNACRNARINL